MSALPSPPWGRRLLTAGLAAGRLVAGAVESALPGESGRTGWQELGNKLDAFRWFQEGLVADRGGPGGVDATFRRLWRTEGEGYRRATESAVEGRGAAAVALLRSAPGPGDLLPLHAGLGLALAERAVQGEVDGTHLAVRVDRFVATARSAAVPGWEGTVLEALGLVVRTLRPELLDAVDRHLAERGEGLRGHLWHGVGRGLYFLPSHVPSPAAATARALEKALAEPPDRRRRDDAVAGLAWALTLVNLLHPRVVERFLVRCGPRLPSGDAFEHGVLSALVVWHRATGGGMETPLHRHRPEPDGAEAWAHRVAGPLRDRFSGLVQELDRTGRWGELFRHRPLQRYAEAAPAEDSAREAP